MADPQSYRPKPGSIPEQPGVYRFSDEAGRVIYVGKAKSLRSRLNSYFADPGNLLPRTYAMVHTAAKVQWTVVQTEVEALALEYAWIKQYDPRFNYTVTCPHCRTTFLIGEYSPGLIRCGNCGRPFNLRWSPAQH